MVAKFDDGSCDYTKESFEQIRHRMLGSEGFPKNARRFREERREAFNLGRSADGQYVLDFLDHPLANLTGKSD
jgi:hypothetical protein